MDTIYEKSKQSIVRDAQIMDYNLKSLINTCDGWLSEEEGRRNLYRQWKAREKARRCERRKKFMNRIFKLLMMKKRHETKMDKMDKTDKMNFPLLGRLRGGPSPIHAVHLPFLQFLYT